MQTVVRTVLRATIYQLVRRLGFRGTILLGSAALALLILTQGASAASYTNACETTDPVCERLTALVAEAEAQTAQLALIEANTAGDGPAEVSGTVALSAGDRERLDLTWWGVWAVAGLVLVLMIAPAMLSVMRVTRGMADGRG